MLQRQLSRQSHHDGSSASSSSGKASYDTRNTASSLHSRRSLVKYSSDRSRVYYARPDCVDDPCGFRGLGNPRFSGSVNTHTSTIASDEDLTHQPNFQSPPTPRDVYPADATPSSPAVFAELFPSDRRLLIYHDDATSDGNMNLRVDTEIFGSGGHPRKLTLFHLRMHDLKKRHFSLRRYCRQSGQEVCSSRRTFEPTAPFLSARSNFQHSLGHTSQQLLLNHEESTSNRSSRIGRGSGRGAIENEYDLHLPTGLRSSKLPPTRTNTVQLEFSNYAHVNVTKRGSKRSKRYKYEFLGTKYEWKRHVYRDGKFPEVSYYLINDKTPKSIAHITPDPLSAREAQEEEAFGGWVRPCSMQIVDRNIFRSLTDVADTIVATGLIVMVDDCIERRWHSKRSFHLDLPIQEAADGVGPEELIDMVFNR